MSHVAYLGVQLPIADKKLPLGYVTYPQSWRERYVDKDYVTIDPVVEVALRSILPTDWATINLDTKSQKQIFGEAKEFGIGTQGLTFPIRGRGGEKALFTVVGDIPESEWKSFKKEHIGELNMLAFHFHQTVLSIINAPQAEVKLSKREAECLKWAAAGKTFEDIGDILNISGNTVRLYLDTARHKLNCLNVTHAVARAIKMELIPPP